MTEALVAIDVNSGRATKEGSIEETALKTNLEAAEEVARQLRLRDLAGLIVIDFIDMDERKNNTAVEKRMKDKLKTDRARIQVGRISGFGLMEMSRQRLRPGMIEATTQPCPHCHGTGLLRSDDNVALGILRQLEEEGVRGKSKEVLVKAPVGIANYLMNEKREHLAQIESRYGISIRIEASALIVSPDYEFERFKVATRAVPVPSAPVISIDMPDLPEVEETPEEDDSEDAPKKRRRRRRRRRGGKKDNQVEENGSEGSTEEGEATDASDSNGETEEGSDNAETEEKPKRRRRSRSRRRKSNDEQTADDSQAPSDRDQPVVEQEPAAEVEATEAKPEAVVSDETEIVEAPEVETTEAEPVVEETIEPAAEVETEDTPSEEAVTEQPAEEVAAEVETAPKEEPAAPAVTEDTAEVAVAEVKPKRRGWWSR